MDRSPVDQRYHTKGATAELAGMAPESYAMVTLKLDPERGFDDSNAGSLSQVWALSEDEILEIRRE